MKTYCRIILILFLLFQPISLLSIDIKKFVIFIADWGEQVPPNDILEVVRLNPNIKLTIVCPSKLRTDKLTRELINDKKIEPVLTIANEPILPLIYETEISSPMNVQFSYPQDVDNIILDNQIDFRQNVYFYNKGLYLRSGCFSEKLIHIFKRSGIEWTNIGETKDLPYGVYQKDDLVILVPYQEAFVTAGECWDWINSYSGSVIVLFFGKGNVLKSGFLSEIGNELMREKKIEMITPDQLTKYYKEIIPKTDNIIIESDTTPWIKRPDIWLKLSMARKVIEDYKNSEQADKKLIDMLFGEIYQLYSYDLIEKIQKSANMKEEQYFQANLYNIYRLLDLPVPDEITSRTVEELDYTSTISSHTIIEVNENNLNFINISQSNETVNIEKFSVSVMPTYINYGIDLGGSEDSIRNMVDIYIDLNNQRGAGSTNLLSGLEATVIPEDAWEFAIRINNNEATLYRSGRYKPILLKKYRVSKPYRIVVPRDVLRGNPIKWGYQVVTLSHPVGTSVWVIDDLLCPKNVSKNKLLNRTSIKLPLMRIND